MKSLILFVTILFLSKAGQFCDQYQDKTYAVKYNESISNGAANICQYQGSATSKIGSVGKNFVFITTFVDAKHTKSIGDCATWPILLPAKGTPMNVHGQCDDEKEEIFINFNPQQNYSIKDKEFDATFIQGAGSAAYMHFIENYSSEEKEFLK